MRLIDGDELKTAFPLGEMVRTECVRATIDNMPTIEPERTCSTCRYNYFKWHMEPCDSCTRTENHWKPTIESERKGEKE